MTHNMRPLTYQDRVLTMLDKYIACLLEARADIDRIEKQLEGSLAEYDLDINFTKKAWEKLALDNALPTRRTPNGVVIPRGYDARYDGCKRPVPNVTIKVPTGGGKTFLAVHSVSRIFNKYLGVNTGFVLWVVPSETIYTQTLRNLKNRQHPYRHALDQAAAGRVKIMERGDPLNFEDVSENLCVMLLMLQAANRETKESLRIFRDRGDVHGFFPAEGDQAAHKAMLERIENLDGYDDIFPMVKNSLGNALRIIRPVVVLDEGHRAVSDLAFKTLYGFNPLFVLEFTATPKDRQNGWANLLVDVTGDELNREGMIKMPITLIPRQSGDWKATLNAAVAKLNALNKIAEKHQANTNRYIRPIMLVQVERTGRDQRDGQVHIHADDVYEALIQNMGFHDHEIAIKTAHQNDLDAPENQNLMSPNNSIRAIITKQALQEGWDCPFAYVLCALAANQNLNAMTQLVGRILRQPDAKKTPIKDLNACYVITHQAETGVLVERIKAGLEREGLGDLMPTVQADKDSIALPLFDLERRKQFKKYKIYLPEVMHVANGTTRPLDYETDILAHINWHDFNADTIVSEIGFDLGEGVTQEIVEFKTSPTGRGIEERRRGWGGDETHNFDPVHCTRMISEYVLNPFVAWDIVSAVIVGLKKRSGMTEKRLALGQGVIIDNMRTKLSEEARKRGEAIFSRGVDAGTIQFRLRMDGSDWQMPMSFALPLSGNNMRQLVDSAGVLVKKSLFVPMYEEGMNLDEQKVALYLDAQEALEWWHRNLDRMHYGVQGWWRHKVYPDFIFAVKSAGQMKKYVLLETKGKHISRTDDSEDKKRLLKMLTDAYAKWLGKQGADLGGDPILVEGKLVVTEDSDGWRVKLAQAVPEFMPDSQ